MRTDYEEWIGMWEDLHFGEVTATCREATAEMILAFPELKRVRGTVFLTDVDGFRRPGGFPHWWCLAEDGSLVDPTASQFSIGTAIEYRVLDEEQGEPIGKCMCCGSIVQAMDVLDSGSSSCCSRKCSVELAEYMGF